MNHQCKCEACSDLFDEAEITFTGPPRLMYLCRECLAEYEEYCAAEEAHNLQCEEDERKCNQAREDVFAFARCQRPRGPTGETAPGA